METQFKNLSQKKCLKNIYMSIKEEWSARKNCLLRCGELSGAEKQLSMMLKDDPFLQDAVKVCMQITIHYPHTDSIYQKVDSITGVHQSSPWMSMVRKDIRCRYLYLYLPPSAFSNPSLNKTRKQRQFAHGLAMVLDTITNSGMGGSNGTEANSLVKGDLAFENKILAARNRKATFSITEK